MTAPSGPDDIDVRVRLHDQLSGPAAIVNRHLKDMEDAAREARRELERLQRALRGVGRTMLIVSQDAHRLNDRLRDQARIVRDLARDYDRLQRAMQMQLNIQQRLNSANNNTGRSTRRFGNTLGRMRKIAGLATKSIALLTAGVLAFAAAMQLASGAQAIMAVIPALASVTSLAAFLPTALFSLVGALVAVKIASKGVGEAMGAALSGDMEKFNEALKKLTPSAQKFVLVIKDFAPAFRGLGRIMQETMFQPLAKEFRPAMNNVFPVIAAGMALVSKELGLLGAEILRFFQTTGGRNMFAAALVGAADLLAGIRQGIRPLLQGLSDIMVTVSPLWRDFGTTLGSILTTFGQWMSEISKNGQLLEWIETALSTLSALWGILSAVFSILGAVFRAAESAGGSLGGLAIYLTRIAEWANSVEGQNALSSFFQAIADIAGALAPLLIIVAEAIGNILAPALAEIAIGLGPGVQAILQGLVDGLALLAPHMGPLAVAISEVMIAIAPLLPVIGELAGLIVDQLVVGFKLIATILTPIIKTILPPLQVLFAAFAAIIQARGPLIEQVMQAIGEALSRLIPFGVQLAELFAQKLNEYLPQFIDIMNQMLPVVLQLIQTMGDYWVAALTQLMPYMGDLVDTGFALLAAFLQLLPALLPIIEVLLRLMNEVVIPNIGWFTFFTKVILGVLTGFVLLQTGVLTFVAAALKKLGEFYNFMLTVWQTIADLVIRPFRAATEQIRGFIDGIVSIIGKAMQSVKDLINSIKSIPGVSFLPGLWTGGPVTPGQRYMTGELGPEIFVDNKGNTRMLGQFGPEEHTFHQPGFVIPNNMLAAFEGLQDSMERQHASVLDRSHAPAMAAATASKGGDTYEGDTHYHVNTTIHASGDVDPKEIDKQIRKTIKSVERERKERS